MSDLADFLLARIAEDEDMGRLMAQMAGNVDLLRGPVSPARILAECEAKRQVVELHRLGGSYTPGDDGAEGFDYCRTCGSGEPYEYPTPWPCSTLRLLSLPYADHPDWREAWRP